MREIERVLLATDIVKVGMLRCPAEHPNFKAPGPTQNFVLVFPRSPVWVCRGSGAKYVADSSVVNFWNPGEVYERETLSPEGAISDWFAVSHDLALDAVRVFDPSVENTPDRPFRLTHSPSDLRLYLFQRQLFRTIKQGDTDGSLLAEEFIVDILVHSIRRAYWYQRNQLGTSESISLSHQEEIVGRAEAVMNKRFRESLSIKQIAAEAASSPFHLCRLFKRRRKSTLHAYRTQLRLRSALESILDTQKDLTEISLEYGFSSHSHFTGVFKKAFGMTPSELRAERPSLMKLPSS